MQITTTATFAAAPERVFAMLIDEAYLTEVCRASEAVDYSVKVSGSTTELSRTLPAPAEARRFTGATLTVVERIVWGAPVSTDGSGGREGQLHLTISGQPVTMVGLVTLTPSAAGTVASVTGELKVKLPLIGAKLEKAAAPAVLEGFRLQETVGNQWLAR